MLNDNNKISTIIKVLKPIFWVLVAIFVAKNIKVQNINCYVNSSKSNEICTNFSNLNNKSLLLHDFESDEVFESLHFNQDKSHSYFLEKIEKKLPNTLSIYLTSKPPAYRFHSGEIVNLVGENGAVKKNISELEVVNVYLKSKWFKEEKDVMDNQFIEAQLHDFLFQLVREAEKRKMKLSEVNILSQSEIELFFLDQKMKFIIEFDNELVNNIIRIEAIIKNSDHNFEADEINQIDMRFKYPVAR